MATYQAPNVTAYGYTPPGTGHGESRITQHLRASAYIPTGLATNDVIQFGYLPANAVVTGCGLKADSQLDSNGSPTVAFDLGVAGAAQLFKAGVTDVGRAVGASVDTTISAGGYLWKNTTGAKALVIATAHAGAATGAAGVLELNVDFFVEDTPGSQA